jgi:hypothetical protein
MGLQELGEHAIAEVGLHENFVDLVALGEFGEALKGLDAVPRVQRKNQPVLTRRAGMDNDKFLLTNDTRLIKLRE